MEIGIALKLIVQLGLTVIMLGTTDLPTMDADEMVIIKCVFIYSMQMLATSSRLHPMSTINMSQNTIAMDAKTLQPPTMMLSAMETTKSAPTSGDAPIPEPSTTTPKPPETMDLA